MTCSTFTCANLLYRNLRSHRSGGGGRGAPGSKRADNRLFDLHDEEEYQAPEKEPWPNVKWHGLGLKQTLQRRRVGIKQLQDRDRADARRQVLVAEMRL